MLLHAPPAWTRMSHSHSAELCRDLVGPPMVYVVGANALTSWSAKQEARPRGQGLARTGLGAGLSVGKSGCPCHRGARSGPSTDGISLPHYRNRSRQEDNGVFSPPREACDTGLAPHVFQSLVDHRISSADSDLSG